MKMGSSLSTQHLLLTVEVCKWISAGNCKAGCVIQGKYPPDIVVCFEQV